jgi:hypothetical protein
MKGNGNISTICIRWLFKQASNDYWDLKASDLANLLGVDEELIKKFKDDLELGGLIELTEDAKFRISMLLAINKALHDISPEGQEVAFFKSPNSGSFLNGISIKEFLIKEATLEAMAGVLAWLRSST